jgi:peptidoglycan hydrolase-like protein with peptidoglycan-binding domain
MTESQASKDSKDPKVKAPWVELRRDDSGQLVEAIQKALNERHGAKLVVDGKFGPKTEEALKKLQREKGLSDNGVASEEMAQFLQAEEEKEKGEKKSPTASEEWKSPSGAHGAQTQNQKK